MVTTTGVPPAEPGLDEAGAAASGRSSALACRTSVPPVEDAAAARAVRSAPLRRSAVIAVPPRATPANAGTAVAVATPGTTSNGTDVRPTASTSLTAASAVYGSPATSRTTTAAALGRRDGGLGHLGGLTGGRGDLELRVLAARTSSCTAVETSGSTITRPAWASAACARAVSMPGSPGPAPTKTTLPAEPVVARLRVIACSWFWP